VNDLDLTFSYVLTDYMQSDLHKIIVSQQPLSPDHIKVFTYQILRGRLMCFVLVFWEQLLFSGDPRSVSGVTYASLWYHWEGHGHNCQKACLNEGRIQAVNCGNVHCLKSCPFVFYHLVFSLQIPLRCRVLTSESRCTGSNAIL